MTFQLWNWGNTTDQASQTRNIHLIIEKNEVNLIDLMLNVHESFRQSVISSLQFNHFKDAEHWKVTGYFYFVMVVLKEISRFF